jgi:hypothetical protein
VNLFAAGSADVDVAGGRVKVTQDTRYPWDGAVKLTLSPSRPRQFTVNVRIPGWARNEPVPTDLYRFLDANAEAAAITVNGRPVEMKLDKGYVAIARIWRAGDVIDLTLPMPVRRVVAHANVEATRDRVALQRGPIVYAAEWPDNPDGKVRNIVLPDANVLAPAFRPDLLNGVAVIKGRAFGLARDEREGVRKTEQPFMAIPYATWANRGRGQMAVWLARTESAARPTPYPTLATTSSIAASPMPSGRGKNPRNMIDGEEPASSADSTSYFDWWPVQGWSEACDQQPGPGRGQRRQCSKGEWIEMTFKAPATVSRSEIYWFDDTGRGGVRVPASWTLLHKDGNDWKPVETSDAFGVARNAWNALTFKPVTTTALRLEVVMQPTFSAGVQEWKVK